MTSRVMRRPELESMDLPPLYILIFRTIMKLE
jgi:hypothetical protein